VKSRLLAIAVVARQGDLLWHTKLQANVSAVEHVLALALLTLSKKQVLFMLLTRLALIAVRALTHVLLMQSKANNISNRFIVKIT